MASALTRRGPRWKKRPSETVCGSEGKQPSSSFHIKGRRISYCPHPNRTHLRLVRPPLDPRSINGTGATRMANGPGLKGSVIIKAHDPGAETLFTVPPFLILVKTIIKLNRFIRSPDPVICYENKGADGAHYYKF